MSQLLVLVCMLVLVSAVFAVDMFEELNQAKPSKGEAPKLETKGAKLLSEKLNLTKNIDKKLVKLTQTKAPIAKTLQQEKAYPLADPMTKLPSTLDKPHSQ